ncbi:MAG: choice-of-anchor B family protein [Balneolaceae bacterium]|nr:choice-of-anchor B family protein [Balneolaceae bacterium]
MAKMFRYFVVLSVLSTLLIVSCQSNTSPEKPSYTPCTNGFSDGFPCNNVSLYAHVDTSQLSGELLSDIWGWIDPETGKEYAIVGLNNGVDIVDVTDPSDPEVIGFIPEPNTSTEKSITFQAHDDGDGLKENSAWRDMKVHKNTLYIVSEQASYGLQFFDLTLLREVENPPVEFSEYGRYTEFGNAHNIFVNENSEYLYVTGSTTGVLCAEQGGLHMIEISFPHQPKFAGCYVDENAGGFTTSGYIHDTQCVIYSGPDADYQGKEICFNSSEEVFLISDVTDKNDPATISMETYPGSSYIHQGWLSEDQRYFFMNDELDERYNHTNTRTYVWDLQDLDQPEMIGHYQHSTPGIDHNLYIKDDFMYQANYTAGLRVLDISDPTPANISEVAYFDTTPQNESVTFGGLWSVYPWLLGDKIIVSDINQGLFILKFQP